MYGLGLARLRDRSGGFFANGGHAVDARPREILCDESAVNSRDVDASEFDAESFFLGHPPGESDVAREFEDGPVVLHLAPPGRFPSPKWATGRGRISQFRAGPAH